MNSFDFSEQFLSITEHTPFAWQRRLYESFIQGEFADSCALPTGLGKTSVIPIWLLALATAPEKMPRRLVYVVNRRTVVDQATREAEKMRERLPQSPVVLAALRSLCAMKTEIPSIPLAISTLRGQFADNSEWRIDPTRPAIIVGTVDMLGSRLLFSGYGCGFKSRPLHAGFLAQDTLLVHDEAHLEPAFQKLIESIKSEQTNFRDFKPFQVMALSATTRKGGSSFELAASEKKEAEVEKRIRAKKSLHFYTHEDKALAKTVAARALNYKDSGQAILIYLRTVKDVQDVAKELRQKHLENSIQVLTGTLRGFERDFLAKGDPVFARFMPKADQTVGVEAKEGTVYLVCTSAGEVGVNISAEHLICDLVPFDSMAQRFGRVNRFGLGEARIDIVYEETKNEKNKDDPFEKRRWLTLDVLKTLPNHDPQDPESCDASPAALGDLPPEERQAAFTPEPVIPAVTDILFDAWALTTIRDFLPGRPPVADWLHGIRTWEPPETFVAWREDVEFITGEWLETYKPQDLLEDYPLKPHELLRDTSERVFKVLETLSKIHPDKPVWVIETDDSVQATTLKELVDEKVKGEEGKERIYGRTVLLPPSAGGLNGGMLEGSSDKANDIADQWLDENQQTRRQRVWNDNTPPKGMRLVRCIEFNKDDEESEVAEDGSETDAKKWFWFVRPRDADDDGSKSAQESQELTSHLNLAEEHAQNIVAKLNLQPCEAQAVVVAAKFHDLGKDRSVWQKSIGNHQYPATVLAKSGSRMRPVDLSHYRHEFGSLLDVMERSEFQTLSLESQELALHLIAAHHGRARPHFPAHESFDPNASDEKSETLTRQTPRRFAQLQLKYDRWGLAYLESLLRAADILASGGGQA